MVRPVPALIDLAESRRGFALIELMVAIALGSVVILIGVAAFQAASRTMSAIDRLSTENSLLRTGFLTAMDDADHWNSTADPQLPWGKRHMSLPAVDSTGLPTAPDLSSSSNSKARNPFNQRPFRLVETRPATTSLDPDRPQAWDPDLPAHDPRSWYRNHVRASELPVDLGTYASLETQKEQDPWNRLRVGMTSLAKGKQRATAQDWESVPLAWRNWRVIYGDYTLVSARRGGEGPGTASTTVDPAPADNDLRNAAPLSRFRETGLMATASYLPPGMPHLLQVEDRFASGSVTFDTNSASAIGSNGIAVGDEQTVYINGNRRFYVGEMPFLAHDRENDQTGVLTWSQRDDDWYRGTSDNRPSNVTIRMTWGQSFATFTAAQWSSGQYGYNESRGRLAMATDIGQVTRQRYMLMSSGVGPRSSGFDRTDLIGSIRYPLRARTPNVGGEMSDSLLTQYDPMFRNRISLMPLAPAGVKEVDPSQASPGSPTLELATLRWRERDAELYHAVVTVADPQGGSRVSMPFTVLGSTLRGARQWWGRTTMGTGQAPIGDRYVP